MHTQRALTIAAVMAAALLAAAGALAVSGNDTITTIAGTGTPGFSGDGGPAAAAQLNDPISVAVDSHRTVYVADQFNNRVRRISAAGMITTFAGTGVRGFSGDGGSATLAQLDSPNGVAVDRQGNVYVAEAASNRVRKVSGDTITTIAGTGVAGFSGDGGPAASAQLNAPIAVAVDAQGRVYVADLFNQRVRMIDGGVITTIAGTGVAGFSGDGGPATQAQLSSPFSVAVDGRGTVYVADFGNNRLRAISSGTITTVAGNGTDGSSGDNGPATAAAAVVQYVSVDASRDVFIAGDQRVRRVHCGVITTIAGNGVLGDGGDGGPARAAVLNQPAGMAFDRRGSLYLADYGNARIRKIQRTRRPGVCSGV